MKITTKVTSFIIEKINKNISTCNTQQLRRKSTETTVPFQPTLPHSIRNKRSLISIITNHFYEQKYKDMYS